MLEFALPRLGFAEDTHAVCHTWTVSLMQPEAPVAPLTPTPGPRGTTRKSFSATSPCGVVCCSGQRFWKFGVDPNARQDLTEHSRRFQARTSCPRGCNRDITVSSPRWPCWPGTSLEWGTGGSIISLVRGSDSGFFLTFLSSPVSEAFLNISDVTFSMFFLLKTFSPHLLHPFAISHV